MTVHALDEYRWSQPDSPTAAGRDDAGDDPSHTAGGEGEGDAAAEAEGIAPGIAAGIVGTDPGLLRVVRAAARVAPTGVPVLVTGESGTGKELIARLLHDRGPAPDGPFVAVNCGTLSRELADSELFGHERGAFTGAHGRKRGWFEEADGGTLVLDEVGELPLELQPKLLRVLETGRLRRVGGNGEVGVKVRVVALTLRELRREAARGAFRLDLYHRLAGFELTLPPLRARPGDVAPLARYFLEQLGRELGPRTMDASVLPCLVAHDWPGNVRELRNVLRRAALVCPRQLDAGALNLPRACRSPAVSLLDGAAGGCGPRAPGLAEPGEAEEPGRDPRQTDQPPPEMRAPAPPAAEENDWPDGVLDIRGLTFEQIERRVYQWALRQHGGSRRKAARALGIARSTFCDKVRRYGLARGAPATAAGP